MSKDFDISDDIDIKHEQDIGDSDINNHIYLNEDEELVSVGEPNHILLDPLRVSNEPSLSSFPIVSLKPPNPHITNTVYELAKHMLSKHNFIRQSRSLSKNLSCTLCCNKSKNSRTLKYHYQTIHNYGYCIRIGCNMIFPLGETYRHNINYHAKYRYQQQRVT